MISVIMANYNGERFLRRSIASVLTQTCGDIELIVSDDGSKDGSADLVRQISRTDKRVRLLADGANGGPAAARNKALEAAGGEWVAIVDSDDMLHPERFERLLAIASLHEVDAVADNLLHFDDAATAPVTFLFSGGEFDRMFRITPELVVRADVEGSGLPNFGYLKPMMKRRALAGLRYDERLKIGEDYDFMLRFLLTGASFLVTPDPTYLYRRHAASISHRLSAAAVEDMIECQSRLQVHIGDVSAGLKTALEARMAGLQRGLRYEQLVAAIKGRRVGEAAQLIAQDARLVSHLFRSANERLSRARHARKTQPRGQAGRPALSVLVTDGSPGSAYLKYRAQKDWLVERVPPYDPAESASGNRAGVLESASRLARICQEYRATLICDGPAGRYAAGFVPFDHVVEDATPHPRHRSVTANLTPATAGTV